jgi:GNAT superfamily N-acetyltransferase
VSDAGERARQIEEASLRAWPALTDSDFDGWRLRFADGYTRRANSITPLWPSRLTLLDKISTCERIYRARGLPPIFRLTPFAQPELDGILEARGYGLGDRVEVRAREMSATIPSVPAPGLPPSLRIETPGLDKWLDAFTALSGAAEATRGAHRRVLSATPGTRRLFVLVAEERPVACGMCVLHEGLLGLFDLVTAPDNRRRGFGAEILRRALSWGERAGAREAYLQVLAGNAVASRLYDRAGFALVYRYHYREPPPDLTPLER